MITRFKKPAFMNIGLFAKYPNRIDATQHYWESFIGDMRSRFMETAYSCDKLLANMRDKELVLAIKKNSLNAVQVLDTMATSIRLDLSSVKTSRKKVRLYTWLADFIRLFSAVNDLKDGDIRLDVSVELQNSIIVTDETLLQQVIYYLLFNAASLGEAGSYISIICKSIGDYLVIEICHKGGGVGTYGTPEQAPFLWDKNDTHDTGRGLYICSLYVEAMNGTISVEERDDATVFAVSIHLTNSADARERA